MKGESIRFYHRYRGEMETEKVYGERWLRRIYETVPGRVGLWMLIRRRWFSQIYGCLMDRPGSRKKIEPFIDEYRVDRGEFLEEPEAFRSFNEFFYRRLKPEARPIAEGEEVAVLPADGRHLVYPTVDEETDFIVKGGRFDLRKFLGDDELARRFVGGSMLLSRLCPVDYHRYHFPVAGVPGRLREIGGPLASVSPIALRRNVDYLVGNKRAYTLLESERFGVVLCAEIGATCVGSMVATYRVGEAVAKGTEKGYFRFGGSSTILLFEPGMIRFDDDLVEKSTEGIEVYARMGDRLGVATR